MSLGIGMALGGLAGGIGSAFQAREAGKEADKNRQFQAMMSNTAHQRQVKDLKAAGLNPILSGMGGAGASTPAGGMAPVPNIGEGVSSGISAAASAQQIKINKPAVTQSGIMDKVLKGPFGSAFVKYDMLVKAGTSPSIAAALSGLDEAKNHVPPGSGKDLFNWFKEKWKNRTSSPVPSPDTSAKEGSKDLPKPWEQKKKLKAKPHPKPKLYGRDVNAFPDRPSYEEFEKKTKSKWWEWL